MLYLDFLRQIHELATPSSYLEIGVDAGESLALVSSPAVGIDPAYALEVDVPPGATLYRGTSDDYFASNAIAGDLPDGRIDLAFVDGMHLFEYALRDFMNVEAHSGPGTVVVLDDMLPRSQAEARRDRTTDDWTGDVWKIIPVLARYRPDLVVLRIATEQTGLLMVMGLDSDTQELSGRYDDIVAEYCGTMEVPADIIDRVGAVAPEDLLAAPFWADLRASDSALPDSVREWRPERALTPEEIEASKDSPRRDKTMDPPPSRLVRMRRRILQRG